MSNTIGSNNNFGTGLAIGLLGGAFIGFQGSNAMHSLEKDKTKLELVKIFDLNKDGVIDKEEAFSALDADKNGNLSERERDIGRLISLRLKGLGDPELERLQKSADSFDKVINTK